MKKPIKVILLIFLFSFILNFIWENLHFPLYAFNTIGIGNYWLLILYASFIDAFWISAVFILIAIIDRKINWKLNKVNVLLFSILLIAIAFGIEKYALLSRRWVYSPSMPIIFGIGISPLLQLGITGLISLILVRKIIR